MVMPLIHTTFKYLHEVLAVAAIMRKRRGRRRQIRRLWLWRLNLLLPETTDTPRRHQRGGSGEIVCRDMLLNAHRHAVLPVDSPQALVGGARRDVYLVERRHALPAGAPIPVAGELLHEPRRLALLGWGRGAVEPEAILKPSLFRKLLLG